MNQPPLFRGLYPAVQQVREKMALSKAQLAQAEEVYIRAFASRCPHEPGCGLRTQCIRLIAEEQKRRGYA
jgi:hypothetical protein